jgi:transposase
MSRRELTRVEVLARVKAGTLSLGTAAGMLGVSDRQTKRLWRRYRAGGAEALRHRAVGRPSNRGAAAEVRQQVLQLIQDKYSGGGAECFGPTLAAEHLASEDGLTVHHETLRRWMLAAGLWSRTRKRRPYRQRRERRAPAGELVQLDGSFHAWFEQRSATQACLITRVDDATSQSLGRFSEQETIWAAMDVLRLWIETHGIPQALYTDWKNVYVRTATALERNHGTHQDRLVKKLRRRGITQMEAANTFLAETYWPEHNARFARPAAAAEDVHRRAPTARQLDQIFHLQETRTAGTDWVVRYHNRLRQLERQSGHAPARSTVTVCEWHDGRLAIEYRGRRMKWHDCPTVSPAASPPTRTPAAPGRTVPARSRPRRPSADHPWSRAEGDQGNPKVALWQAMDR